MSENPSFGFLASGTLFGYDTEALIAKTDKGLLTAGRLRLNGDGMGGFAAKAISGLPPSLSGGAIFPRISGELSYTLLDGELSVIYTSGGLVLAMRTGARWSVIAALNTSALANGNSFEKFVYDAASWAGISQATIMLKSDNAGAPDFAVIERLTGIKAPAIMPPDTYKRYSLVAGAVMNLGDSQLGKGIKALTGLSSLSFFVGGNPSDASFAAALMMDNVKCDICEITDFGFKISSQGGSFGLSASGNLTLKLDNPISFIVAGELTMTSFLITAASVKNTKFYITKSLFLSDIGLAIGYNNGLSIGLCGRATNQTMSMFAGINIICSPTPRISLLTAAVTSVKGSLSLKDIIEEIAEIKSSGLDFLDVVVIKDFDLQNVKLEKPITAATTESEAETLFNKKIASEMRLSGGDAQLTPLGDKQYILTDKGRMRHYRIDANGVVSLNCQVFICSEAMKLGQYDIKPGFFFCGILEIFSVSVRFLFDIKKAESLTALVSMSPIKIGKLISITKSSLPNPVPPISGGLAGQLVNPDSGGAMLYINVNKSTLNLYLTARIQILSLFTLDALVIIRDRLVYIDVERTLFGFKTIVKVAAAYDSFSSARFAFAFIFDTSEFKAAVDAAAKWLTDEAKKVESSVKEAQRKLTEAQNKVNSLQSDINSLNSRIDSCKRAISNASWIAKPFVAVGKGIEIAAYEVAKAGVYVVMKVAVLALEAAKAIVGVGGTIASSVLNGIAKILTAVTQLFWLKRLELSMDASASALKFKASLNLTVMGSDKLLEGSITINTTNIGEIIFGFVKDKLLALAKEIINPFRAGEELLEVQPEYYIPPEYDNLGEAMGRFEKGREMMDNAMMMFIDIERAHYDIYGQQNDMALNMASDIAIAVSEYEASHEQLMDSFDEEFLDALDTVRDALPVDRAGELNASLDSLEMFAKKSSETRRAGSSKSVSLMKSLERETNTMKNKTHRAGEQALLSPLEANKAMAEAMERALTQYFGDVDDDCFINPAGEDTILDAISMLRFSGKRKKQKRPQNPSYTQRLGE